MEELFEQSKEDKIQGLKNLIVNYDERLSKLQITDNWKKMLLDKMKMRVVNEIQKLEKEN